ncbi:TPA: DUF3265 domain-containing protein [Vibrio vulnificus]|nr:DUF3265 domain-containing protein [Vibrio vulnificus]ELV8592329.1 DUF3265 domain-containing protein [Vibrio vulnificus]HAS6231196.1 DUF3265 domain-containing protein [Vibrio vulnificus]HAS6304716.1 DUF3265 domain-containing protein [Vibrio vulnificus]HDY7456682.1 DUF3265 domain-containing protein [Vibrio vulnificus]
MTRRLRGIHAAWHFWYAVICGGESGVRKAGLCGIHPLTQRYMFISESRSHCASKISFGLFKLCSSTGCYSL